MKNRKKLLKYLEQMESEKLARVVELPCAECPAKEECDVLDGEVECAEAFKMWLDDEI